MRASSGIYTQFKKGLRSARLDRALHDCRHTYASHYLREGGNIFRLSRYLGPLGAGDREVLRRT